VPRVPLPEPELAQVPVAKPQAVVPRVPSAPGPVSTRFSPPVVTTTVAEAERVNDESVSYANCSEVRDAGAAPISEGDPGWREKFDRDGDGVGCE
jgi:hypothetical protein